MLEIKQIEQQIDKYFEQNQTAEAELFMQEMIEKARKEKDNNALLILLNELIGYYRETSQAEKSFDLAKQAEKLLKEMGLAGSIPYATTLLNIANAYRAGGKLEDSLSYYNQVIEIYQKQLSPKDMLVASFYNNKSLLYQEMGDFLSAKKCLLMALAIVKEQKDAYFELAVTYANLASTCLRRNEDEEAAEYFQNAITLFEEHNIEDAHYSAALNSLGMYYYKKGKYDAASENFQKAMECIYKSLGENEYYNRVKENLQACETAKQEAVKQEIAKQEAIKQEAAVLMKSSQKGIELCKAYYETYGKPMIHNQFPEYENKIAVGLVGEGSDCFGFDDEISKDHDWGPSFCMWVSEETYEKIGKQLQEAYKQLPSEFMGYSYKKTVSRQGENRRGVSSISSFYKQLLGEDNIEIDKEYQITVNWKETADASLAAAVNGEVFYDKEGYFTKVRQQLLQGYPESIQYLKLADSAAKFSQTGQYNLKRMKIRKDFVTAQIMLGNCIREAIKLIFYMQNQYPPHDKWLFYALQKQMLLEKIEENQKKDKDGNQKKEKIDSIQFIKLLKSLGQQETTVSKEEIIEELAKILSKWLYQKGFISDTETYLDAHTEELVIKSAFSCKTNQNLVDEITELEFKAFDKVRNVGGRASCQNDWYTFSIMRKSQYMTWNRNMLLQYFYDFHREFTRGHNLIEEKYGRMMESTAPDEYNKIKDYFPELDNHKKEIIEAVVQIQVGWMEEFEKHYPTLAGNARSIHTSEDSLYNTSYETYLRGEISTYSDKMLELYGNYIVEYAKQGQNLAYSIMKNSVHLYGYSSLEDAEEKLKIE